jgi:F-type H+-transporting ATPase subunit b
MTRTSKAATPLALALAAALSILGRADAARASEHAEAAGEHAEAAGHGASHGTGSPAEWNWFDMGYGSKDSHGGKLEPGDEKMAPPALFALINFAIFAGILLWKAGPAIKKFAQQRHVSIKEALAESARLRDEARRKLDEYSKKIAGVDAEVEQLIAGIRADAEAERARILAEAEVQAATLKRDAEQRIAADLQRARRELEREVVAVAIAAAEKLIREKATAADQHKLIDVFITELSSEQPTSPQERA